MKYSIITVNYNNKEGLRNTIESVIHQTYRDFEFIVIDGGSTDGSAEVLKEYDSQITYWVSEKDKGIYNAMNKGIAKATGDYLNFMNSGDCFYDEGVLGRVARVETDADFIVGRDYHSTKRHSKDTPPYSRRAPPWPTSSWPRSTTRAASYAANCSATASTAKTTG